MPQAKSQQTIMDQIRDKVLPVMTAYASDLEHDLVAIEENPNTPFLHWAGSTFTYIAMLPPAENYPAKGVMVPFLFGWADRQKLVGVPLEMANHFAKRHQLDGYVQLVHHFDGRRLREISIKQAVEIARQYRQQVEREWKSA